MKLEAFLKSRGATNILKRSFESGIYEIDSAGDVYPIGTKVNYVVFIEDYKAQRTGRQFHKGDAFHSEVK
jgi:hypothetical protein